jgi:hypothetical protein
MPEVLQNIMNNAQSLEGLEYVGFCLICLIAAVGVVAFLIGLSLAFKPAPMTSVADLTGVFQGLASLLGLAGGAAMMAIAYGLMTTFFGGS